MNPFAQELEQVQELIVGGRPLESIPIICDTANATIEKLIAERDAAIARAERAEGALERVKAAAKQFRTRTFMFSTITDTARQCEDDVFRSIQGEPLQEIPDAWADETEAGDAAN